MESLAFTVPDMSCSHCEAAVTEGILPLEGVQTVTVDLPAKRVTVEGHALDEAAIRAAIEEAGYEPASRGVSRRST